MANHDDVFRRALETRFKAVEAALNNAIETIAGNPDGLPRKAAILELGSACEEYETILNPSDHPDWLKGILASIKRFRNNSDREGASKVLRAIITHHGSVRPVELGGGEGYASFDRFFEELHETEKVTERFDKLAAAMQTLIDEEQITDIAAIKTLERMIAALKANRKSSFFSTVFTNELVKQGWAFVLGLAQLANHVTSAMKNISEMVEENDHRVQHIGSAVGEKAAEQVKSVSPRIRALFEVSPKLIEGKKVDVGNGELVANADGAE